MDKSLILKEIMKVYGFDTKTTFASFLNIKPSSLGSWFSRNTFDHELLYDKLPGLNPEFLFSGEGPVKIDSYRFRVTQEMIDDFKALEADKGSSFGIMSDRVIDNSLVPLFDIEAISNDVLSLDYILEQEPIDHISIPNLPKCDGAIYVIGDHMYPILNSRDIVMFKCIEDIKNDIFWGEMYLVVLNMSSEQLVMVKYIQKSELGQDYVKLVSENKHHQDKDIKMSKISGLGLIKASVRINSMN